MNKIIPSVALVVLFGKILARYRGSQQACICEGLSGGNVSEEQALADLEIENYNYMRELLQLLEQDE